METDKHVLIEHTRWNFTRYLRHRERKDVHKRLLLTTVSTLVFLLGFTDEIDIHDVIQGLLKDEADRAGGKSSIDRVSKIYSKLKAALPAMYFEPTAKKKMPKTMTAATFAR